MTPLRTAHRSARTLAILGALAALAACKPSTPPGGTRGGAQVSAPPTAVQTAPVARVSVEELVTATGTVLADEDAVIGAKVTGRVVAIEREIGDLVQPGDVLAKVEAVDYELALEQRRAETAAALARIGLGGLPDESFDVRDLAMVRMARVEAENAAARLERARQLFEASPPLIAEQDYADIRTTAEVARNRAEVELLSAQATLADARARAASAALAAQQLADTVVRAPAVDERSGGARRYRVAERLISAGEYVQPGQALYRLVASDVVKLRVQIPERFAGAVRVDQEARVRAQDQERAHPGRVWRVSPVIDPDNRTFVADILIDNGEGTLKPGAFARAEIVTGVREGVVMVPERAVIRFAGVNRVFSVKDGKAVEHRVQVGVTRGEAVEIVAGLDADGVVVRGQGGLVSGAAVQVEQADAAGS